MSKIPIKEISKENFNYIIHISDIHIRPLERHDEYRKVFNTLNKKIDEIKSKDIKAIIVITGDTFESKTTFHPETYKLCKDIFDELINRYPVILIAGNHDMKNIMRLDSLSPIV